MALGVVRWFGFNDRPYVKHESFDSVSGHKSLKQLDMAVALCNTLEQHKYPYIRGISLYLDDMWDVAIKAMEEMEEIPFWTKDYRETYWEFDRIADLIQDTIHECKLEHS